MYKIMICSEKAKLTQRGVFVDYNLINIKFVM